MDNIRERVMKKLLASLLLLPAIAFAKPISDIITFGDSLSDTGNLYAYTAHVAPKSPPYFKGHFSDGHVWAEKLYQNLFSGRDDFDSYNYAVGGAGAVLSKDEMLPYTISTEISDYLVRHPFQDKSTILFTIWAGGNNYLNSPADHDYITDKVTNAIGHQIERLAGHGAQYFFVPNLPDIGRTPYARQQGTEAQLSALSKLHNQKLALKLQQLRADYPNLTIIEFNVGALFDKYYDHPEQFGIKYVEKPCFSGGILLSEETLSQYAKRQGVDVSPPIMKALMTNPQISESIRVSMLAEQAQQEEPLNCQEYLFFDRVHPTNKVHNVVADFALQEIKKYHLQFEAAKR